MITDYAYHPWKAGDFYFYGEHGVRLLKAIRDQPNMWLVRIYDSKYERTIERIIHVINLRDEIFIPKQGKLEFNEKEI